MHLLAVPRRHVTSLDDIDLLDAAAAGRMLRFVAAAARSAGLQESGYRVISNSGRDAGQMVEHLHWHIVGGRPTGEDRMTEKACGRESVEGRMIREEGPTEARMKADATAALKAGDKRRRRRSAHARGGAQEGAHRRRRDAERGGRARRPRRERKKRLEAVEVYEQAGRAGPGRPGALRGGAAPAYMPAELTDEELAALVDEAVAADRRDVRPRRWARSWPS